MSDWVMLIVSGMMSSGVVIAAWLCQSSSAGRRSVSPSGMDPISKSLLDLIPNSRRAPVISALIWFLLCFLVDILFPLLPPRGAGWSVIKGPLQAILALGYVVLIPILLWCYLSIATGLQQEPLLNACLTRTHLDSRNPGRFVWWAAILAAGLVFQYFTIRIQTSSCSSTPPWLWVHTVPVSCGTVLHLNWQGAAHAALRGLDAMLGLGLSGTVVAAAISRNTIAGATIMESHGNWEIHGGTLQCKASVQKLGAHLALAGFLAITLATLHLLTIQIHRHMMNPVELKSDKVWFAQFFESTWAIWGVMALVWAGLALFIMSGIHRRAKAEVQRGEVDAVNKRKAELPRELQRDVEHERLRPSRGGPRAQVAIDQYWNDRQRIHQYYAEKSWPYPVPAWLAFRFLGKTLVSGFILSVIANVVTSLVFLTGSQFLIAGIVLAAVRLLFPHVPYPACDPSLCNK
jgi:hypothetical protein